MSGTDTPTDEWRPPLDHRHALFTLGTVVYAAGTYVPAARSTAPGASITLPFGYVALLWTITPGEWLSVGAVVGAGLLAVATGQSRRAALAAWTAALVALLTTAERTLGYVQAPDMAPATGTALAWAGLGVALVGLSLLHRSS